MKRPLAIAGALVALALIGGATTVVIPRVLRKRAVERAIVAASASDAGVLALADFAEDGDAALALIELREKSERASRESRETYAARKLALRRGIELHATRASDPRVEKRLREWVGDRTLEYEAFYLLDELREPRYADAESARAHAREGPLPGVCGNVLPDRRLALDVLASQLRRRIANDRALCGAERMDFLVFDGLADPLKALRAWAAISGCELRERDDAIEILAKEQKP